MSIGGAHLPALDATIIVVATGFGGSTDGWHAPWAVVRSALTSRPLLQQFRRISAVPDATAVDLSTAASDRTTASGRASITVHCTVRGAPDWPEHPTCHLAPGASAGSSDPQPKIVWSS